MVTETRYPRSDSWTVNTKTLKKLMTARSGTAGSANITKPGGDWRSQGMYWGIRVWKVNSSGVETEITSGTPVAVVSRTTEVGGLLLSATWACPLTSLVSTDAIIVRVYGQFGTDPWGLFPGAEFITEQLGAQSLDSATWTVYYYTDASYSPSLNVTTMRYYWDTATYDSKITNFSWTLAPSAAGGILVQVI